MSNNNDEWLGKDLKTWSQSIRNGYVRSFILFALHETGVFETLKSGAAMGSDELAAKCNIDAYLLNGVLNFLTFADTILVKKDEKFSLSEHGKEWLFSSSVIAMSFGAVGAYSCLLYELVPALRGEKRYGEDFIRRGDYIAIGSHATGKANYPWVVSKLFELGVNKVVDLGCGSADVIISFCQQNTALRGVGIDISTEALEEAKRRIEDCGLSERISLFEGDITEPETYSEKIEDAGAFNAIMALHEFLRDGDDYVIKFLRRMKELFPGRYLLVGEFDSISDNEYTDMDFPDRIHPLFYQYVIHPLTWQGLPTTQDNWLRIFDKAGLEILEVNDNFPFRLVEYVLRF